jgi:hypothetical protein
MPPFTPAACVSGFTQRQLFVAALIDNNKSVRTSAACWRRLAVPSLPPDLGGTLDKTVAAGRMHSANASSSAWKDAEIGSDSKGDHYEKQACFSVG